jgi:uncharacterized protein with NRDE domain
MCTVIVAIGCNPAWPILIAANRDERRDRPARPPGHHWPSQPDILGGLDVLAGGTWLALNSHNVVACVLNRSGTLGPEAGKRSRGELPLLALQQPTASGAVGLLAGLNGEDWRSFNMIVADHVGAYFVRGVGHTTIEVEALPIGIHMVTAHDANDTASPRVVRHLPLFRHAAIPNPPDWGAWPDLLGDSRPPVEAAINVTSIAGFGTVSSALVALGADRLPEYWVADVPGAGNFHRVQDAPKT